MPEMYQVVGATIEVHKHLGCGFLEAVYQEALYRELTSQRIPFQAQVPLRIHYKDDFLEKYYITDFLAFDQILVEIKSIAHLGTLEIAQILNYLKATSLPVGLLINFGSVGKFEWKRFANTSKGLQNGAKEKL